MRPRDMLHRVPLPLMSSSAGRAEGVNAIMMYPPMHVHASALGDAPFDRRSRSDAKPGTLLTPRPLPHASPGFVNASNELDESCWRDHMPFAAKGPDKVTGMSVLNMSSPITPPDIDPILPPQIPVPSCNC